MIARVCNLNIVDTRTRDVGMQVISGHFQHNHIYSEAQLDKRKAYKEAWKRYWQDLDTDLDTAFWPEVVAAHL